MRQIDLSKLKQIINFHPNPIQKEILLNLDRFTIVNSGKRAGKSTLCAYLALRELFLPDKNIWVVGPNHDVASRVWDYLTFWIYKEFNDIFKVNKHEHIIENSVTNSKLVTKTAETESSLLGKGLDLLIVDEASRIDDVIWNKYLQPNLMDYGRGKAVLISNPYGYNWFWEIHQRGLPHNRIENPGFISFSFPTAIEDINGNIIGSNNPSAISVEELQRTKKITPYDIWRVEYLGQFQEGAGTVFKNWEHCIDNTIRIENQDEWFENPNPGHLYYIGVDIAKVEDFTVVCVIDRMTHRLVGFYRVNNVLWEIMRQKVLDISLKYYDAEIILDATGNAGDMFAENLEELSANVDTKFVYTAEKKVMLMDKLAMKMSSQNIRFPAIRQLLKEIQSFTYHMTPSGNLKYGSRAKDDCVNALALACWKLNEEPLGIMMAKDNVFGHKMRSYK